MTNLGVASLPELARAEGIARIARALKERSNWTRALRQVCEEVRQVLGTTAAAIRWPADQGRRSEQSVYIGVPESLTRLPPIPRQQFGQRSSSVFAETRLEVLRADRGLAGFTEQGLRCLASATLREADRVLGMLTAESYGTSRAPFEPCELLWLEAVSDMLVQVVSRERATAAAEERGVRYQRIISTLREGVWCVDKDYVTEYVNPALTQMLGYEAADMTGRSALEFVHPKWRQAALDHLEKRRKGISQRYEFGLLHKNGNELHVVIFSAPLKDSSGKFCGALAVVVDSEEQRLLALQTERSRKVEVLGALAGSIAHDFNNLLVAVLGNAAMALEVVDDDPVLKPALMDICTAAKRASELTSKMRAYSGSNRVLVQRLNLTELVLGMNEELHTLVSPYGLLKLSLADDLPQILGDAGQIREVLTHLVLNACESLSNAGGEIQIRTGVQELERQELERCYLDDALPEGDYVFLEATDTGSGMTPEVQAKMFDPFFSTKFPGRGLSLSAVLGILRSHGAAIDVWSEVGRGTRFRGLFPCVLDAAETAPPRAPQSTPRRRGSILVVDDEELVRAAAKRVLESAGYKVELARDGLEAVQLFAQRPDAFAAVLLDLTMPRLSGKQALMELRRIRADIPVVLTSGYSERDVIEHLENADITEILQKPWTPSDLLQLMDRSLRHSGFGMKLD